MTLHDQENAVKFDTEAECASWIADRIVRFKLKVSHGKTPEGTFAIGALRKDEGKILDTKVEGFKSGGVDEPLSNYAEPTKQNGVWLAVMKLQE